MKFTQIYTLLNETIQETIGESTIVNEDLSNIVDIGATVLTDYKDGYCKSLLNKIGKMVFVDRKYTGFAPKIVKDSFEWGSIMSKSRVSLFDAVTNPSWGLTAGTTVNQFEYNPATVSTKLYNDAVGWQIECSFTDTELKQSFSNIDELNRFYSMIYNRIDVSATAYLDNMIMRTINYFIASKINNNNNGVIDLLSLYNTTKSATLTAAEALNNADFLKFAAYTINVHKNRLNSLSMLYNVDGYPTFTPNERMKMALLNDFGKALETYLYNGTATITGTTSQGVISTGAPSIGEYTTVPYWQGSGTSYAYDDITAINITLTDGTTVSAKNIIGVLFDDDAIGVFNDNRRVTTSYNANGEYYTNYYKFDTRYFNDLAENGVIFTLGAATTD